MKLTTKKPLMALDDYYHERYMVAQKEVEDFCKYCPFKSNYHEGCMRTRGTTEDCPAPLDPREYYCNKHHEFYELLEYLEELDEKATRLYAIMDNNWTA